MTTQLVRPEAAATITVSTPVLLNPAFYGEKFESGLGGWAGYNATANAITWYGTPSPGGGKILAVGSAAAGAFGVKRTLTGLTAGRVYVVSANLLRWTFRGLATNLRVGVTGIGYTATTNPAEDTWEAKQYTFTATTTTHELVIDAIAPASTTPQLDVDDIKVQEYTYTPTLPVSEGRVTLADDWTPYVQAVFDVPLTDAGLSEQIDPRGTQRVVVTASEGVGATSRTFDLGLRARSIDHRAKTITMELASDEALLMDRKNVSGWADTTPRTYETSLRGICNWALSKIGASLQPGTADADLTARWSVTNLFTDPRALTLANFTLGAGGSSLSLATGTPVWPGATSYVRWNAGTAGQCNLRGTAKFQVTPGRWYVGSVRMRASNAGRLGRCSIRFFDAAGNELTTAWSTPTAISSSGNGSRHTLAVSAPPGAETAWLIWGATNSAVGDVYAAAGMMLYERGDVAYSGGSLLDETGEVIPEFCGATTGGGYTYTWAGAADASASQRTPATERPPALFAWTPGQSLWDFLQPMFEASGLRLFCDEGRKWRLVNPATYAVAGSLTVQEKQNAVRGEDEITRNDDTWADAIVCIYEWTDGGGIARTAYDYAGVTTGKCVTLTYQREYPGPGAAAYALARLQGLGRTQTAGALIQYTATPGQAVTITLPGTLSQTGKLREVIFDLKSGLMDIATRA